MKPLVLSEGSGRTRISLAVYPIGSDRVVVIYNDQAHLGAAALADYHIQAQRASTSVLTRLGHKDDALAYQAAHRLCRHLKGPVCAIAGVHLDDITEPEIAEIRQNCDRLLDRLIRDYL